MEREVAGRLGSQPWSWHRQESVCGMDYMLARELERAGDGEKPHLSSVSLCLAVFKGDL